MDKSNYITMIDRGMEIIDVLYQQEEAMGISEISKKLNIPKATVFRILNTYEKWGMVQRVGENGDFVLGLNFVKYGERAKNNYSWYSLGETLAEKLSLEVGETVNIGKLHEDSVLILYSKEGESSLLVSRLFPVSALYCSAMGKVFLTEFKESELKAYFEDREHPKRTVYTITNFSAFQKEKEEIKEKGIAYDREEYEYGLTCLAQGIHNGQGKLIGAMSISGPTTRMEFKGFDQLEEKLKKAVNETEKVLKYYQDSP